MSRVEKGDSITLEVDQSRNADAVYDLLDKIGVSLPLYNVTQVELVASTLVVADKPPKSMKITIMHPNSCSLKYDELDMKLREMLVASGIEPKEPIKEMATIEMTEPVEP